MVDSVTEFPFNIEVALEGCKAAISIRQNNVGVGAPSKKCSINLPA